MVRCVNCSISLVRLLKRQVNEATDVMLDILRSWIRPATMSPDDFLCQECFNILQRESMNYNGSAVERSYGHKHVCFVCGISILSSRTHKVPLDSDEGNIIMSIIPTQQLHRLEKVCMACWASANRSVKNVKKHAQSTTSDENVKIPTSSISVPGPSNGEMAASLPAQPKITSRVYKRGIVSSNRCIFSGCRSKERLLVPSTIKELLLLEHKLYIPTSARICKRHFNGPWDQLNFHRTDFTGQQMDDMMAIMDRACQRQLDFTDITRMDPHLCHYWFGIDSDKFHQLLSLIPQLSEEVPCASVALSILLVKLRTGDSNDRLATLFKLSRTTLSRYMIKAKNCLENACVQLNSNHT